MLWTRKAENTMTVWVFNYVTWTWSRWRSSRELSHPSDSEPWALLTWCKYSCNNAAICGYISALGRPRVWYYHDLICAQQAPVQRYSTVHRVTSNHFKGAKRGLKASEVAFFYIYHLYLLPFIAKKKKKKPVGMNSLMCDNMRISSGF